MKKRGSAEKYSSLTLLGRKAAFPASPDEAKLETFKNPYPAREYVIRIETREFTSLCPVTGQPDFAEIVLEYKPAELCLETKSLKLYFASFRNTPSFNEEVVNRILNDLVRACAPRQMRIVGKFGARGGLALTVVAEHPGPGEIRA